MTTGEPIQRVRIYLSESDTSEGQPLYLLALERLRREGASGATAMRGIAGFGAGHRLRTAGIADLSQATPVIIEWLDRADRVARVLPMLEGLIGETLVTIEDIRAYRAALRSGGPFGGRAIADVGHGKALMAGPHEVLGDVLPRMADSRQTLLVVVDGARFIGSILPEEVTRFGAPPLDVLRELDSAERTAALAKVAGRTLREVVTESRTIYIESSVSQTVNLLVEWGLDSLPVVDRQGQVVGVFGVEEALRAALETDRGGIHVRDVEPPPPVSLIMQMLVPTIPANAPIASALTRLLQAPLRMLVLVNGAQPAGLLSLAEVSRQAREPLRGVWLAAVTGDMSRLAAVGEALGGSVASDIAAKDIPLIQARATEHDAIRALLEGQRQHLVVVDDEGRIAGMVTRRGLLRALAQESSA